MCRVPPAALPSVGPLCGASRAQVSRVQDQSHGAGAAGGALLRFPLTAHLFCNNFAVMFPRRQA